MVQRWPNPYRPGFNQQPLVLAGRQDVLDGAAEALEVAAFDDRTPRPLVLVGPRGMGKTVTLGEIAEHAGQTHAWPSVHVEVKAGDVGLLRELSEKLLLARQVLDGTTPKRRRGTRITGAKIEATAFGVGAGVEVEREPAPAEDFDLDRTLGDTMSAAVERQSGLVITIDELQNAPPGELNTLGGVLQANVPQDWPLVTVFAALPSLRSTRGPRRLPTYLERAEWHELGILNRRESLQALTGPASQSGRPMTDAAAAQLADVAGGYPYALQVAGHYAWRASSGEEQITIGHARAAEPRIRRDLEQLFQGRWDDASPREREYLRALAARSPAPTGGDVARELGKTATEVSYLRDRLLKKGTIYVDAAGCLHFITPGMASWVATKI
jgi:hypothetical protein